MKCDKINILEGIMIILLINFVSASGETNLSTMEEKAALCLNESEQIVVDMINENFSIKRVNDSLKQADNLFHAQQAFKDKKGNYDYSLVFPYCDEIKKIKEDALNSRDELFALEKFYEVSLSPDMNTSEADKLMAEIGDEIENERYEKVKPLVEKVYEEIINIKSASAALNVFYKSTTRNLKKIFIENWKSISISIGVLLLIFFIYKKRVSKWIIRRKIEKLEIKRKTLKELTMKTQGDYFNLGNISEGTYTIKIKKFAELIRDIDRQIPLLREGLMKMGVKNNARSYSEKK